MQTSEVSQVADLSPVISFFSLEKIQEVLQDYFQQEKRKRVQISLTPLQQILNRHKYILNSSNITMTIKDLTVSSYSKPGLVFK